MTNTVKTDFGDINYILTRKSVKNINFRFKPDGIVRISANRNVSERLVRKLIEENAGVITSRLNDVCRRAEHTDGDHFYFMGRKYDICIIASDENRAFLSDRLELYTNDEACRDKLISAFYSDNISDIYMNSVNRIYEMIKNDGTPAPTAVNIKTMKSRWGSCNIKTKAISLNTRLIKYPVGCLDYVVLHEFAHFHYADHSRNFYGYIEKYMPDYKKWSDMLKLEYYEVAK